MSKNRLQYISLISEAITENFGEQCSEFDPDCYCCRVWDAYGRLVELSRGQSPSNPSTKDMAFAAWRENSE